MDVGLVGAGILSGVLGAHIITMLRERLSLGTWIDSLLGVVGGGVAAELVTLASSSWANASAGFAVGRIAAVITVGMLGGAILVLLAALVRGKRAALRDDDDDDYQPPFSERRTSDRRKGDRRLGGHDG